MSYFRYLFCSGAPFMLNVTMKYIMMIIVTANISLSIEVLIRISNISSGHVYRLHDGFSYFNNVRV